MSQRHLNSLFSLFPPGLFNIHRSENLKKLFTPIAGEFQTFENFIKGLYDNIFSKNSDDAFLAKWGRFTGQKIRTRELGRAAILRQLKKSGGATVESFVSHLKDLGFTDGINGKSLDARVIPRLDPFDCNSNCNQIVWGEGAVYAFAIELPRDPQIYNCNSRCDASLVENQREEVLQYLISGAPAHTRVIFFYDGLTA